MVNYFLNSFTVFIFTDRKSQYEIPETIADS